jgi:hypothetical protein
MRRVPLSIEVQNVLKMLSYTLLGMLVAISAYFFIKTTNTAERGYSLRENQLRQRDLEAENRILKFQESKFLKNKRDTLLTRYGH